MDMKVKICICEEKEKNDTHILLSRIKRARNKFWENLWRKLKWNQKQRKEIQNKQEIKRKILDCDPPLSCSIDDGNG